MSEDKFSADVFDPDFFEKYIFPDSNQPEKALTFRRFMRDFYYGPDLRRAAFMEIRFNNAKIFTGTIQQFLGIDTLFSVIDVEQNKIKEKSENGLVKLFSVEQSSGLIFQVKINVPHFSVHDLKMNRTFFDRFDFVSGIYLKNKQVISLNHDGLIRGRSFFIR